MGEFLDKLKSWKTLGVVLIIIGISLFGISSSQTEDNTLLFNIVAIIIVTAGAAFFDFGQYILLTVPRALWGICKFIGGFIFE